jgi:protein-tyrosine-phosphatase
MNTAPAPEQFSVAFVCTGNRFRSVLAEAVLRGATKGLPVSVSSYGTLDLGPAEPLPGALREAHALGLQITTHVARSLAQADLSEASLVLGFELEHAVAAVDVGGARLEHTFILPELVQLLDRIGVVHRSDPIEQARENLIRAQAGRNGEARRTVAEIEDPILLPEAAQRWIAQAVYSSTETLATQLFGGAS